MIYKSVSLEDLRVGGIEPQPGDVLLGVRILGPAAGVERARKDWVWPVMFVCCGREGRITRASLRARASRQNFLCSGCAQKIDLASDSFVMRLSRRDRAVIGHYDAGCTAGDIARMTGLMVGDIKHIIKKVLDRRERIAAASRDKRVEGAALVVAPVVELAMSRPWGRASRRGHVGFWDRAA